MSRIYDRTLPCGCLISSDGGGGLIPCCASESSTPKLFKLHNDSWGEWIDSEDYQTHLKEIIEFNKQ